MAIGPRWVPDRAVTVPSHGTPQTAASISPATRSSGVRHTGSFMNVWMPCTPSSRSVRLTYMGPGVRDISGGSSYVDARIGDGLQDVDDGVDQDVADTQQQRDASNGREVVDRDALCGVLAKTRPGEDLLDDENAGEHQAHLQAGHRQRRADGVAEHVMAHHARLLQP